MTTDKQFNNQVCEVVRAAGYLQDAGFFCTVTFHTKGIDLENGIESRAAFVAISVYNSPAEFADDYGLPLIAEIVSQDSEQSLAGVARQMEALIP